MFGDPTGRFIIPFLLPALPSIGKVLGGIATIGAGIIAIDTTPVGSNSSSTQRASSASTTRPTRYDLGLTFSSSNTSSQSSYQSGSMGTGHSSTMTIIDCPISSTTGTTVINRGGAISRVEVITSGAGDAGGSGSFGMGIGGGSTPGDPNNNRRGYDNIRVLQERTMNGYRVSMDLERGGSGLTNIHLKVNNTKYFYNQSANQFINSAGNQIPNSLQGNPVIDRALHKALNALQRGW